MINPISYLLFRKLIAQNKDFLNRFDKCFLIKLRSFWDDGFPIGGGKYVWTKIKSIQWHFGCMAIIIVLAMAKIKFTVLSSLAYESFSGGYATKPLTGAIFYFLFSPAAGYIYVTEN